MPAVRRAPLHRGLPGGSAHPRVHPRPARGRHARSGGGDEAFPPKSLDEQLGVCRANEDGKGKFARHGLGGVFVGKQGQGVRDSCSLDRLIESRFHHHRLDNRGFRDVGRILCQARTQLRKREGGGIGCGK